jgi:putative endonuclease
MRRGDMEVRERPPGWPPGGEAARRAAEWRERAARGGEQLAEQFLRLRGMLVVDRNVHSGRGELDLIAYEGETVVFVEVKLRSGADDSAPLRAVGWKKRLDMSRAATRWLQAHGLTNRPVRFDVVGITWETDGSRIHAEHIRNAFPGAGPHFF